MIKGPNNIVSVLLLLALLALFAIVGCVSYSNKWEKQSFARACNQSGGIARNIDGMLQCVGEKP